MTLLRPLLAALLALVLALTSGTMAVARGQAVAAGQIVICSGQGTVTLTVDAEGNPVGPAHICPDCALSFLVTAPAGPTGATRPADWQRHAFAPTEARRPAPRPATTPIARGPPSPI